MNDLTIIGTGIVGLSTAYHLRNKFPDARILLIDKESGPAMHQSGRNSGVIHSGVYYTPGSLKAVNCIKGYRMLLDFCKEHQVKFEICGKMIVATDNQQLPNLKHIYNNGIQNGLSGLAWMESGEIREREPLIRGVKAIRVPQAGIIDYTMVAGKLKGLLESSGVEFQFNSMVVGLEEASDHVRVETIQGSFETKRLVTCAGLYADKLAAMSGSQPDCKILPFRGEYYRFKEDKAKSVNHLIYPVPDPDFPFLGVHFTKTIDGGLEAGPNAVLAFAREGYTLGDINMNELMESLRYKGFQRLANRHMAKGLLEMKRSISKRAFARELQKLMPDLRASDLVKSPAGVRAQAIKRDGKLMDDYYFLQTSRILHVINAPSPAATSSLSIGDFIANSLIKGSN